MAKRKGKHPSDSLTGTFIREVKNAGFYPDGNGLYLRVDRRGSKRWILRTVVGGERRDIGLGSFSSVSLVEARVKARVLRTIARRGEDPFEARGQIALAKRPEVLRAVKAADQGLRAVGLDTDLLFPS